MTFRLSWLRRGALLLLVCALAATAAGARAQENAPAPAGPDPRVTILVELDGLPAAAVYAQALHARAAGQAPSAADAQAIAALTQAQVAALAAQQVAVQASLEELGARTLYTAQRVYNGIAVSAPAGQVEALRAVPGVRSLSPIVAKWPDTAFSVPLTGAPDLWSGAGEIAARGEGITIAVIDSGIDYVHAMFGGSGDVTLANDVTQPGDHPDFPSAKIVGGFDFAGDSYNASPNDSHYNPIPSPDGDPMDCMGHGTHVAGIAAGYGVTQAGHPYQGPWDTSLDTQSLRIGPGVAPLARLYALRIFGCSGSSEIVDQAIEWAVDPNGDGDFSDHVDVINLSLGSSFGLVEDSTSRAVEAATEVGVIVVASAGNQGNTAMIVSSPGVAPSAISVAAGSVAGEPAGAAGTQDDVLAGFSSRGPAPQGLLKPDLTAPGYSVASAALGTGSSARSRYGTSMAAPHAAGGMALLRQLHPTWSVAALKALAVNTAAPVVRAAAPYTSTLQPPTRAGSGRIDLPSAARSSVIAYDAAQPEAVGISFGLVEAAGSVTRSRSLVVDNRGAEPLTYRITYQPLVDIPGVEIGAAGPPTLTVAAGAQVAAPVLLKAEAGALQNVRDPGLISDPEAPTVWQNEETGLLWLWPEPAVFTATAPSGEAVAGARFDAGARTLWLSVTKPGGTVVTQVALMRGTDSGTPASFLWSSSGEPPAWPVAAEVTLEEADVPLLAAGMISVVLSAEDGSIVRAAPLRPTVPVLKTPVYVAARAASAMRAGVPGLDFGASLTATVPLPLAGAPLTGTAVPTETRSLVSLLELHLRSPRRNAVGLPPTPGQIDFQYLGLGTDFGATGSLTQARVFFGLAVYEPWSSPSTVRFEFDVDSTGDGDADYRVFTTDLVAIGGGSGHHGSLLAGVRSLSQGTLALADPLNALAPDEAYTAIFNSRVMLVSVPARLLGVRPGRTRITVRARSAFLAGDNFWTEDASPLLTFDVARPGLLLDNGQARHPLFADAPESDLRAGLDLFAYSRSTARGLLLLHHHNSIAGQAEALEVRYLWPHTQLLPLIQQHAP